MATDYVIEHPNRDKAASKATRAVVFLLLLSGVASDLLTNAAPYHPPTPAATQ